MAEADIIKAECDTVDVKEERIIKEGEVEFLSCNYLVFYLPLIIIL